MHFYASSATTCAISRFLRPFSAAIAATVVSGAAPALGQDLFSGSITIGVEAERKTCTNCGSGEKENKLETTPIELILRPINRPELSFGIEFEHDIDSEGSFFGSGRSDKEINNATTLWARRELTETTWARVQGEYQSGDKSLDLGGRFGFHTDLSHDREFSSYINIDRRFAVGSDSEANKGTFVEVTAEHEWDWDEYGAWLEGNVERWFYDASDVEDETRLTLTPGFWFALGETPHKGLVWIETERRERLGDSNFDRRTNIFGIGAEFDLGNQRELVVGVTFGREKETQSGRDEERREVSGLIMEFKTRF